MLGEKLFIFSLDLKLNWATVTLVLTSWQDIADFHFQQGQK